MRRLSGLVLLLTLVASISSTNVSGQPKGKKGGGKDEAFVADRDVFHYLLQHHKDIRRTVKNIDGGVETVTESDQAEIVAKIQEHVAAMHERVKKGNGIHLRDPLFRELFAHYDQIEMKIEKTKNGVRVTETSKNERVAQLIQAHAVVVTKFIENGHAEAMKNHPVPEAKKK